jgi:hypothetical protein
MVYNKNCKQFLKEYDWLNEFAFNLDLEEIKFYYPFSDETTMNVLLWKYKYNKRLPFLQMNIDDINNVKEYYESNYENEKEVTSYVRVPSKEKRRDILFFHGAKGELSNEIVTLQNNVFNSRIDLDENRYYISSNIDFDRELSIIFYDGDNFIYSSVSHIKKGFEYWFSPGRHLNTVNDLNVKIYDGYRLIYKKV